MSPCTPLPMHDQSIRAEEVRSKTICANPECWRRLCKDWSCSLNFCCYVCERNVFGESLGARHGPSCCKKENPHWTAGRAPLLPSPDDDPVPPSVDQVPLEMILNAAPSDSESTGSAVKRLRIGAVEQTKSEAQSTGREGSICHKSDLEFTAKPSSKWSTPERRPGAQEVRAGHREALELSTANMTNNSMYEARGHRENCTGSINGSPTVAISGTLRASETGLSESDRHRAALNWRQDPGARLAMLALDTPTQKLDWGNAWPIAVEEPMTSARTMGLVNRKRRAHTAASVWDDDLEDVRSALEARCAKPRAATADFQGEESAPESEAFQRECKDCKRSPSQDGYDSPSVGVEPEGREGCNSEAACVGSVDDALYHVSGVYCGVFCARCSDILREEDKNLIARLIENTITVGSA